MQTALIKEKLHHYIDTAKESQLQAIYTILEDKILAVDRIDIETYNREIDLSEKEYEEGNFISQQEFVKEVKKW